MPPTLSTRERVMRTIRGQEVDRIPIAPPIPWHPVQTAPATGWRRHPNFTEIEKLAAQFCDAAHGVPGLGFDRGFLSIDRKYIETERRQENGKHVAIFTVHTPKGDLRKVTETREGVATTWTTEPLIKDKEDVERILSVPYSFRPPDVKPYFEALERVNDEVYLEVHVSSPIVCVSDMMDFTLFLEWCAAERETIFRLIDVVFKRFEERLEYILKKGVDPIFWVGGSEQATPPMMSPQFYDDFVVAYDGRLFDLIHHYGGYVHIHCHGKIDGALDKMVAMGADMLDPVEPPPDGDITMAEAKRRVDGRLTLMGNIEFRALEFATPEEIDASVKEAVCSVRKDHTFLYPSAVAISEVTDRYRDNAIQYIRSGVEYGTF